MQLVASLSGQHVTALAFGPKELGLQLATAGRDGMVRVYQAAQSSCSGEWVPQTVFQGSASSPCTALCWRCYSQVLPPMLLLGTEEGAKVFYSDGRLMSWELAASLGDEAVDDVAWTTTASGHDEYIASAQGSTAKKVATLEHRFPVCQVEWNSIGTWLAVATDAGDVSLWRPNLGGEWSCQSKIEPQDQDVDYVMVEPR
ncbi:hypothetical protein WJX75_007998 [Coccomyxa subellipsoidea]|uniref:WD40 repeat-like protein n=1 Tax=Coccomyxa subellipsoidea TaxID=248742 RepID=A0ABR2YLJ6_9CHLO